MRLCIIVVKNLSLGWDTGEKTCHKHIFTHQLPFTLPPLSNGHWHDKFSPSKNFAWTLIITCREAMFFYSKMIVSCCSKWRTRPSLLKCLQWIMWCSHWRQFHWNNDCGKSDGQSPISLFLRSMTSIFTSQFIALKLFKSMKQMWWWLQWTNNAMIPCSKQFYNHRKSLFTWHLKIMWRPDEKNPTTRNRCKDEMSPTIVNLFPSYKGIIALSRRENFVVPYMYLVYFLVSNTSCIDLSSFACIVHIL